MINSFENDQKEDLLRLSSGFAAPKYIASDLSTAFDKENKVVTPFLSNKLLMEEPNTS